MMAYDSRLWKSVSLRPEVSGLHVGSLEALLALIRSGFFSKMSRYYMNYLFNRCVFIWRMCSIRFGPSLRYIELPIELITHTVLHELGSKCPNLTHMLLDFSTAMQLHDFNELQVWFTALFFTHVFNTLSISRVINLRVSRPSYATCAFA